MAVIRVATNIATDHVENAAAFYADVLGMRMVMDHGWIVTFASDGSAAPQVSIASEGGSGIQLSKSSQCACPRRR